jgi:hypothetical protein
MLPQRIVTGGQTGVDRAAWDAALEAGLPIGGWVPRGRRAEDGPIPSHYGPLGETETDAYEERTERNARDSDGTLILFRGELAGGSLYTREMAARHRRPHLALDLDRVSPSEAAELIRVWIERHAIRSLNVAGPRASLDPGLYPLARSVLEAVIREAT